MATDLTVKFYYDFKSPFTYLAFDPTLELERTYRIRLRFIPHLFDFTAYGGTLAARDERSWRKVRYLYADARRYANERGLIIRGPQRLFDSRLALMSGLFSDHKGRFRDYARHVWELFFKRELDIEKFDDLARLLTAHGMDPEEFRTFSETAGPAELKVALDEGDRDGVFGVPTIIIEGEMFWGNDRVDWAAKKLDAMGLRRS
ncbi:MAG TPA: DsbA family protein [Candidatus Binataceae bacterium]|nr:DsbA family protein [Candidatus Binataceae bacterium]